MVAGKRLLILASVITGVMEAELSLGARFRGRKTQERSPERRRTVAIAEDILVTRELLLCKYDDLTTQN